MQMSHAVGPELLALEQAHLLRLTVWAGVSILAGTLILAAQRLRARVTPLPLHFAIQCIAWGSVDLAIVWFASRGLSPRDLAGAIALDRFLWLNIGLDIGYVMLGVTLVMCGRRFAREGLVGAGSAIVVQGLALAALDAQLSALLVR
jgi:hypothetical protein